MKRTGSLTRAPSRCKHCKAKFTPQERKAARALHEGCIGPWADAFAAKQEAKRERAAEKAARAERVATREKLDEFKRLPDLIAIAQRHFNAFVRARDKHKGCFVCLRPFDSSIPGRALHAGHVRSRGAAGHLRFVEDNCMGECEGCNGPRGAKPHQIKEGAIRRIGKERFEELENDNTPHKWTRDELIQITKTYKAKLKELKA